MSARPSPRTTAADCVTFRSALDAVVDGAADALSVARADAHAAACDDCRRHLVAAREYLRRMRRVGEAERAPDDLRERVMASMRGMHGSRTR